MMLHENGHHSPPACDLLAHDLQTPSVADHCHERSENLKATFKDVKGVPSLPRLLHGMHEKPLILRITKPDKRLRKKVALAEKVCSKLSTSGNMDLPRSPAKTNARW